MTVDNSPFITKLVYVLYPRIFMKHVCVQMLLLLHFKVCHRSFFIYTACELLKKSRIVANYMTKICGCILIFVPQTKVMA
jgi:hypothetical protein